MNHDDISWLIQNLFISLDGTILLPHLGILEVREADIVQKRCRMVTTLNINDSKTIARVFFHKGIYRCSIFPVGTILPDYLPTLVIEETDIWKFYLKVHWALMPYVMQPYFFLPKFNKPKFLVDD